jgi:hypothetical protein
MMKNRYYKNWLISGKPMPPPHIVKQRAIEDYAKRFNLPTLVETGTYLGDMVYSQRKNFKSIISIELQPFFYINALRRFKKNKNIEIIQGDSADILDMLATKKKFDFPCLFWLDGHYSAGDTALGKKETPIMEELESILGTKQNHVILIDDARHFIGKNDYPTIEKLKEFVLGKFPKSVFSVIDDIMRIEIIVS